MSDNKTSSIDVLWNAIPNEAKLNMPFGAYEIVSRIHKEEMKNSYWAGIDDHLNPNKMPNSEGYYELTFGGNK